MPHFSSERLFVWPSKMVSVSVPYLFYQPMDLKIKTWTLRFPAKENPNMEKALFDWPIVLQNDVKAKYQLISRKFFGYEVSSAERSLNQQKAMRVCIRSIHRSNCSISVRLLLLFCSRVFTSRSYENRSILSSFGIYRGNVTLYPVSLKSLNASSHQLNCKHNSPFLLFTTIFRHQNCFLSSFATDGKDGHGLKLQKLT